MLHRLKAYFDSLTTQADSSHEPRQWWSDHEEATAIARYLQRTAGCHGGASPEPEGRDGQAHH